MPTAKPRVVVYAEEARVDAWKAAAKEDGRSFNLWAGDALDAAAHPAENGATVTKTIRVKGRRERADLPAGYAGEQPRGRKGTCSRERFHRPGQFCKTCGATPA